MTIRAVITSNMAETVGKAIVEEKTHIGYFDIHVLCKWVEELKKNTPIDADLGRRLVSISSVKRDESIYSDQFVVLCGHPIKDIGGNVGRCIEADRGIVCASYLINPVVEEI